MAVLEFAVAFTSLGKLCKNAGPKPFCWAKQACFGFPSSNFNVQGHIISTARDALRLWERTDPLRRRWAGIHAQGQWRGSVMTMSRWATPRHLRLLLPPPLAALTSLSANRQTPINPKIKWCKDGSNKLFQWIFQMMKWQEQDSSSSSCRCRCCYHPFSPFNKNL
jgi:hypothetical protein